MLKRINSIVPSTIFRLICLFVLFKAVFCGKRSSHREHSSVEKIITDGSCTMPIQWRGNWTGIIDRWSVTPVSMEIRNSSIDIRGQCKHRTEDQYLFMDLMDKTDVCWRYIFLYDVHPNVLQFKETSCLQNPGNPKLAFSLLPGDSTLVTLFRANAQPEPCPIQGPFYFNYSSNIGHCLTHKSRADTCASSARLKLNFEACPELPNSNTWTDQLLCLANWHDARHRYFAAKLTHNNNEPLVDDIKNYRCFVYDQHAPSGTVGISADASCRALESLTIHFNNVNSPSGYCKFPNWLVNSKQMKKHLWHLLAEETDDRLIYDVHRHDWVVRNENYENISTTICITEPHFGLNENTREYIVYTTKECSSYYYCLRIFQRSEQLVEILESRPFYSQHSTVCSEESFAESKLSTLILKNSNAVTCPLVGRYQIDDCSTDNSAFDSQVIIGCNDYRRLTVDYLCKSKEDANYDDDVSEQDVTFRGSFECLGNWMIGDLNYLIVADDKRANSQRCLVFSKIDNEHLAFYDVRNSKSCHLVRDKNILFNVSKTDSCSHSVRSHEINNIQKPDYQSDNDNNFDARDGSNKNKASSAFLLIDANFFHFYYIMFFWLALR